MFQIKHASLARKVLPFRAAKDIPLSVHATYTQREIMSAFNARTKQRHLYEPREGVYFHPNTNCNLLFVTLTKDERDYSSTTMYQDYALSPSRFHWQSQSGTRPTDEKGKRHVEHKERGITPLMFVRATKLDDRGLTNPYTFLGPARLVSAEDERPMNIEWELENDMPTATYLAAAVAAG